MPNNIQVNVQVLNIYLSHFDENNLKKIYFQIGEEIVEQLTDELSFSFFQNVVIVD